MANVDRSYAQAYDDDEIARFEADIGIADTPTTAAAPAIPDAVADTPRSLIDAGGEAEAVEPVGASSDVVDGSSASWVTPRPGQVLGAATSVAGDVFQGAIETPAAIASGLSEALNNILELPDLIGQAIESVTGIGPLPGTQIFDAEGNFDPRFLSGEQVSETRESGGMLQVPNAAEALGWGKPESTTGKILEGITEFVAAFGPLLKAASLGAKAVGASGMAASVGAPMAAGAAADFVITDMDDTRLSEWAAKYPAFNAVLPEYMTADDADIGPLEHKMKAAIEGAGLGVLADTAIHMVRGYRAKNKMAAAGATPEQIQKDIIREARVKAADDQAKAGITEADLLGDAPAFEVSVPPKPTLADQVDKVQAEGMRLGPQEFLDLTGKIKRYLRAKQKALRSTGDDMTEADWLKKEVEDLQSQPAVQTIVDMAMDLKANPVQKPETLATFMRRMGGIQEARGELRAFTDKGGAGGLVRKDGMTLDDAALRAWEEGFIPGMERPDINEFLDALRSDYDGGMVVRVDDMPTLERWEAAEELRGELARYGVDLRHSPDTMRKAIAKEIGVQPEGDARTFADLEREMLERDAGAARGEAAQDAAGEVARPIVKVNLARFQGIEDVDAAIQALANADQAAIAEIRRGRISHAQTTQEARGLLRTEDDLAEFIGRDPGMTFRSQAEAKAAADLLVAATQDLTAKAKIAAAADATPGQVAAYARAEAAHAAIQRRYMGYATEAGRILNALKIPAAGDRMMRRVVEETLSTMGGVRGVSSIQNRAATIANLPLDKMTENAVTASVSQITRDSLASQWKKAGFELWINGLLSGFRTLTTNALSTGIYTVYNIPTQYAGAGMAALRGSDAKTFGEVNAQVFGMAKSARDAFKIVARSKAAQADPNLSGMLEQFGKVEGARLNQTSIALRRTSEEVFGINPEKSAWIGHGADIIGHTLTYPGPVMAATDTFFKAFMYRNLLNAKAYRTAMDEGLSGADMEKRIREYIANPPQETMDDLIENANVFTFTNRLGEWGSSVQLLANRTFAGRLFLPFLRTPMNLTRASIENSPFAALSRQWREDVSAGGGRKADALGRMAVGTMAMMAAADWTMEGRITGYGPVNRSRRRMWQELGYQPFSVRIGDKWYSYNRMDPVGMTIGFGAMIGEMAAEWNKDDAEEFENITAGAGLAVSNLFYTKTWATGVADVMSAVDPHNPMANPLDMVRDMGSTFLPLSSIIRQTGQAWDPTIRSTRASEFEGPLYDEQYPDDIPAPMRKWFAESINRMRVQIGSGGDLAPARDMWGKPMSRASGHGFWYDFVSPMPARTYKNDKIGEAVYDSGAEIGMPGGTIGGVNLTNAEYDRYSQLAGELAREVVGAFVSDPGFKSMPRGLQKSTIEKIFLDTRRTARGLVQAEFPSLQMRIARAKAKRGAMGMDLDLDF